MFWHKKSTAVEEKLRRPQVIPGLVQRQLATQWKINSDLAQLLKAVVRKSDTHEKANDIRIFYENETLAKKVQVNDYTTLDEHPDLILYEGWFNEASKQVELQEKKNINWNTPIFTEAEILQKMEALSEPGGTVFFFLARGGVYGGPLGKGAAVIELNPDYSEKKGKKYNIYTADVLGMQPIGKGNKFYDSNKAKEIASWVKGSHHKRMTL
jgi:hypothetical protein